MGKPRYERSLREYDYVEDLDEDFAEDDDAGLPKPFPTGTEERALPFYIFAITHVVNATITIQHRFNRRRAFFLGRSVEQSRKGGRLVPSREN